MRTWLACRVSLKASRSGATAAEFALVVPVLMTLVFGAFEYGCIAYAMSSMQFGANVVARDVAVNNLGPAEAAARLQPYLPGWMQGEVEVSLTQSNPADPRLNMIRLQLETPAVSATPFAMMTRLHPWTLSAWADVRQELPYVD